MTALNATYIVMIVPSMIALIVIYYYEVSTKRYQKTLQHEFQCSSNTHGTVCDSLRIVLRLFTCSKTLTKLALVKKRHVREVYNLCSPYTSIEHTSSIGLPRTYMQSLGRISENC